MKTSSKKLSEICAQIGQKQAVNYAEALRQLKQVEGRLEQRKKQMRAEGMKSDRGRWQAEQLQKKAKLRMQMKNQSMKLQNQFSSLRAKQLQKIANLKKQAQRMRQEGLKKRSMSRLQVLQSKIRLNHDIREKSLHATEKLIFQRDQELESKRQRRLSLYGSRKQSRRSFEQFQASRIIQIRNTSSRQRDELLQKLKQREKELSDLQRVQTTSSRLKAEKEHSTAQNLKSIDQSMRIYNPTSSNKKARKRSMSDNKCLKESGTLLLTQV